MPKRENAAVIILAAGRSTRMQAFKPLLPYDDGGTFLEKIITVYHRWGCREIIVIVNEEVYKACQTFSNIPGEVTFLVNNHLEYERFYSVKLGLSNIRESEYCFLQNADNPFITSEILNMIFAERNQEAYVSPVFEDKGGHPVLLNRNNMEFLRAYPANNANLKEVMSALDCRKIPLPFEAILININTMEEYQKYVTAKMN